MKIERIKAYLAEISAQWKTGSATEHSYRAALQSFLSDIIPGVTVVNEPSHIDCGAPDILVRTNAVTHAPIGYVETKNINADQYFDNVPQTAWDAFIGGYQPAQKWLKDRKGRVITADDVLHYKAVVLALIETAKLTAQLSAEA